MNLKLKDKIKLIRIDEKLVAWKIFQIPSLSAHYKSFNELIEKVDPITNGSVLNKPDKILFNKALLIKSYSQLFKNFKAFLSVLKILFYSLCILSVLNLLSDIFLTPLISFSHQILAFTLLILSFILLKYQNQKPYIFFKNCLTDETIFCYLYSCQAIYIEKRSAANQDSYVRLNFGGDDSKINLISSKVNSQIMPYLNVDKWGFIKNGEIIIDFNFDYVDEDTFRDMRFSNDGLALVNKNTLYGYINKDGKVIIDFQYLIGERFVAGLAIVVNSENKYGVIDKNNNTIIEFKYENIQSFTNDIFIVQLNGKFGLVNTSNETILKIEYENIGELNFNKSIIEIKENETEKFGYINSLGDIIIKPMYKFAFDFVHDFAVVEKFGKYELFSEKEMDELLKNKDFVFDFEEDEGDFGVINSNGEIIIPFKYEEINIYELVNYESLQILITASIDFKWGIIYIGPNVPKLNSNLITSKFTCFDEEDLLNEFESSLKINEFEYLRFFELNNKYGFKDSNNEIIIEPEYDYCYSFKNGICVVMKNDFYGIINLKGEIIVDFIYEYIWLFEEFVLVSRKNKFFYLDNNGNELAYL